ncbi:hypothetical protein [Novosphingobium sp. EMRT-2]|uniref:hypothetical protein n=1 Tax=Novosphingobium sp. EMRT-2 TaxID=2571749 RepID=UPI0010BCFA35|nr:hypothetical protein [Novosphingobium sp. EMRT-2]QCI92294.1 hypothetical protein FA702_01065 [Novosphingobium sp. EMRT-2]
MIALMLLAAGAVVDTKAPYRVAIERIELDTSAVAAGACTTRALARAGRATSYAIPDGVAVDWSVGALGLSGPNYLTIEFHEDAGKSYARVLYRRPYSAASATNITRNIAKTCFTNEWNRWAAGSGEKVL